MATGKDRREHYIPLRRHDLIKALTADLTTTPEDTLRLQQICRLLEDAFHVHQYRRFLEVMEAYAPFDPDSDTLVVRNLSDEDRARRAPQVCDQVIQLLREANFRRLARDDIQTALQAASDFGLKLRVDFDRFEQLEVFVRGEGHIRRARRNWRSLYRRRDAEVEVYRRLAVVFRLKPVAPLDPGAAEFASEIDAQDVHVKLFKNIPKSDIEMLLPGVLVEMSWLDRGRILLPTISGLGLTAYKLAKGAVVLVFAGIYGMLGFLGLVGGILGYGVKSLIGYMRTKDKYQLRLTRSLYYQNLDNNAGAIFRLLAEAEEQEMREVILGYFLLWRDAGDAGWNDAELDAAAESFLKEVVGESIDFEIGDALRKLERLRLVDSVPGGRWRAVSLNEAWERLRQRWQQFLKPDGGEKWVSENNGGDEG